MFHFYMRFSIAWSALFVIFLSSACSTSQRMVSEDRSTPSYNPRVGPFDSRGNYIERWADKKQRTNWFSRSSEEDTRIAQNDVSPPVVISSHATPLAPIAKTTRTRVAAPVKLAKKDPYKSKAHKKSSSSKKKVAKRKKPSYRAPLRYTVKKGDTLWSLSRRYKTTVAAIQRANGLKDSNIRVGKIILIPRY